MPKTTYNVKSPVAIKLIEASCSRHITEAINHLPVEDGLAAIDEAIFQTEEDIEVYLSMNLNSLAASKASLLAHLERTKSFIMTSYLEVPS